MAILKFLHVLFIFVWIGSLLTLTRLAAYQAKETPEIQRKLGKIFRKAYLFVDLPSMILAVAFGLILLFLKDMNWKAPWLHMKLTFAFLLIVVDLISGWQILKYSKKPMKGRGTNFKILHGLAGLFLIFILIAIYILKARVM